MSERKTRLEIFFCENEKESYAKTDEIAFKEINYSREQLQLDLVQLKLWLKNQHHLPPSRLKEKDNFLTLYLTACKGSLEKTKRKLDAYYSYRGKSEVYKDRNVLDENYRTLCAECYLLLLPKPTENGEIVFASAITDILEIPPYSFLNSMKRLINISELAMRIYGINRPTIQLIDYGKYTPSIAATYSPALMSDTFHILQEIFPSRVRKMVLFNVPPFFEIIINTCLKPFLTNKIKNRLIVTTEGREELTKYVEKAVLPKDWFGDYPLTMKEINDIWNEHEIAHKDWFLNELSEVTDESKRVDTSMRYIQEDSNFGVQGSLKKLVID